MVTVITPASVQAPLLVCDEGVSFWGGVDAFTGKIIDAYHPQNGRTLAGHAVMMPTSRGSCTGSGVLLGLALAGHAPQALIFRENEDILTLGALIAARLFGRPIAVLRLSAAAYDALAQQDTVNITETHLRAGPLELPLEPADANSLQLSDTDLAFLEGRFGEAARLAMDIIATMAIAQGARRLTDVTRVHIDGCIYASPAFLTFARAMADNGGRVRVPTTTNAISVDHQNWRAQGVPRNFGEPASQLADAYVEMGTRPCFTCAPYQLTDRPAAGENIAWAESNAVIYANSVLAARTVKHADFMDLCIALTGRAPLAGVYLQENRRPRRIIDVEMPKDADDAFWPMLGWLIGRAAPDRIPLVRGLEKSRPNQDDLKALCGAYGTTSASPMFHIAGMTPEADLPPLEGADHDRIGTVDFIHLWGEFNQGPAQIDLVALGSPHFSADECAAFAELMNGNPTHPEVTTIITLGRETLRTISENGVRAQLEAAKIRLIPDLCWCSISEPVFPPDARVLMTNSGKYAHYAPGLSSRDIRFGSLAQCAVAAQSGMAPLAPPDWMV